MNLRNMTIGQKIVGAFGTIIVLLAAAGFVNHVGISSIIRHGEEVMSDELLEIARNIHLTATLGSLFIAGFVVLVAFLTHRGISTTLGGIAQRMADGSSSVATVAAQVSSSSQRQAEGASEQVASLEEISSSLEEVAGMTQRGAENAGQADEVMKKAADVVHRAEGSMQRLIESMGEISTASTETQKIVKTIDEIAFQTNLLALNAAVEAARAGEAGAGFAVVADEVRNLAMRAAEAARNTSTLIEGTVDKVQAGSELVSETSGSFGEAAKSINQVSTLMAEIAGSTSEQATAISQVSTAVSQVDTVTHQNAATAEQSATASAQLSTQSEMMNGAVRDLVRVIGGVAAGEGAAASGGAPSSEVNQRPRPPSRSLAPILAKRQDPAPAALPTPVKAKPAAAGSPKSAKKKVKPEDIIPMDDDDFQDF